MAIIHLIRHAENDYLKQGRLAGRIPGIQLNDTGISQANWLSEIMTPAPIVTIYSSPLERAMQTAVPIANNFNKHVEIREELNEIDYGLWQGKSLKSLRKTEDWKSILENPSEYRFPKGESFLEAFTRIQRFLETIQKLYKEKDEVICVSHGDIIKMALTATLHNQLNNFQYIIVSPASISTIILNNSHKGVLRINFTREFIHQMKETHSENKSQK